MSGIVNKVAKYAINKAKKSRWMQSVFEAPIDVNTMTMKGTFTDSFGNQHKLYSELRNKIKPGWENIFKNESKVLQSSPEIVANTAKNGRLALDRIIPLINTFTKGIMHADVLEVGCHYGGVVFSIAEKGANSVTGSDYSGYKASSTNINHSADKPSEEIDLELSKIRKQVATHFSFSSEVKFYDDDITNSKLPANSYDIALSYDVLEHIKFPQKAFEHIQRILKPGGIAIHEYNPFFSLNGGHSACTLDFPWGHVRLNDRDFKNYINQIRPNEHNKAISFYTEGLNRMCIADLKEQSNNAGLNTIAIIEFSKEQHSRMLNSEIYNQCKNIYSRISVSDLVTPKIIVVQQKL